MQKGRRYLVSGNVQGVYFRASTQKKAQQLSITGWVKNLTDGKVEVYAFGDETKLIELQAWLWQGPPVSKVDAVEMQEIAWQQLTEFAIR